MRLLYIIFFTLGFGYVLYAEFYGPQDPLHLIQNEREKAYYVTKNENDLVNKKLFEASRNNITGAFEITLPSGKTLHFTRQRKGKVMCTTPDKPIRIQER